MFNWLENGVWYAQRYTDTTEPWMGAFFWRPNPPEERAYPTARKPRWGDCVLAWPTLERLAYRKDRRRMDALLYWRNLVQPAATLSGTVGNLDTNVESVEDEMDVEGGLEIRPTERELLRAVGWKVIGKARWHHTSKKVAIYEKTSCRFEVTRMPTWGKSYMHGEIRFGELRFRGSHLVEWTQTKAGKPLAPIERPARGKSAAPTARSMAKIRQYLCLDRASELPRGAVLRPNDAVGLERVPCRPEGAGGNGTYFDPLPGKVEARAKLEALMATYDGPITKCPPYVLPGKQWVGGVVHCSNDTPNGQSGPYDAKSNAASEMMRIAEQSRLRASLAEIAVILDMAISDSTAKEVALTVSDDTMQKLGLRQKYSESSADKYGTKVIDRALDALIAAAEIPKRYVADNDNEENSEKIAA